MINVYEYLDYRKYLKDYYEFRKSKSKDYSFGVMANKAQISSRGLLKLIMDGKRNLSLTNSEKLIQGLGLNKSEANYFSILVQFNQAKNFNDKDRYYEKLLKFRSRQKSAPLQKEQYNFYSKWYFPVLHELTLLANAPAGIEAFADWAYEQLKVKVSVKDIMEACQQLMNLGLLRLENGKLTPQNTLLESNVVDELNFGIQSFHSQMLSEAQSGLKQPLESRDFTGVTLAFRRSDLSKAKKFIAEFRKQFNFDFSADSGADCVYQLSVQLFELADGKPLKTESNSISIPNSAIASTESLNTEGDRDADQT